MPIARRRSQAVTGALVIALSAVLGAPMLYAALPGPEAPVHAVRSIARVDAPPPPAAVAAANAYGALEPTVVARLDPPPPAPMPAPAPNGYGALFGPGLSLAPKPVFLAQGDAIDAIIAAIPPDAPTVTAELEDAAPPPAPAPVPAAPPVVESVPVPAPRPPELSLPASRGPARPPARQVAQQSPANAPPAAPPDNRSFIEKLFGLSQHSGPALAYAAPGDGLGKQPRSMAAAPPLADDRATAVYDIAAHTVYLPDGTKLEAHSGLGDRLDDPRSVRERDRGATPPAVYQLDLRPELFHGVQALRLSPVGGDTFGRTGLLAHSFMLGPNGDSNGCVSFRDYNAFLRAFQNGQVKRLAVVARTN